MISLDTETTGIDFDHGAMPYLVIMGRDNNTVVMYEWDVDPLTRRPVVPPEDVREIGEYLFADGPNGPIGDPDSPGGGLIFQNAKFDFTALETIGLWKDWDVREAWRSTHDTLIASHVLESNRPHNLTDLAARYLGQPGLDMERRENALKEACNAARRMARSRFPEWKIAKAGPDMPSLKPGGKDDSERPWKNDTWLPKLLAKTIKYPQPDPRCKHVYEDFKCKYCKGHEWWTVTASYAAADAEVTLLLWKIMRRELRRRDVWGYYRAKMDLVPVLYGMHRRGITVSKDALESKREEFQAKSEAAGRLCVGIAAGEGVELNLPKTGNNKQLTDFCFDTLKLPVLEKSEKTGAPSLNKEVIEQYLHVLPERSKARKFIEALRGKRKLDTSLSYMEGYFRFGVETQPGWLTLHPLLNPTGTSTTRLSSSNPNGQNVSKQEDYTLRGVFGPPPGYEWWAIDYENIELRIPAYESGEEMFIDLFERPDDPPYFGSNHLLVCHILHPKLFEECKDDRGRLDGRIFKSKYKATWYQWVKNGNFAVQYGAMISSGTADRAYHVKGAQAQIADRLRNIEKLSQRQIALSRKTGYVETMPDKTINPRQGYPLLVARTDFGKVLPTTPLSYHVQGTAGWCGIKAMLRTEQYLNDLTERTGNPHTLHLNVHDELVFQLPRGGRNNLPIVTQLKDLMEESGNDIGVPLKASVSYHPNNWGKEESYEERGSAKTLSA